MKNTMLFYIGLSFLSNRPGADTGALRTEGRRILRELDRMTAGEQLRPPHAGAPEILTGPGGRPYFNSRHADFNISHTPMMAAVVYFTPGAGQSTGAVRTGCDVQYADPKKHREEIARNFFSSPEQSYIFSVTGKAERSLRFCHIWTLKECFLKVRGLSIFDIQKTPSFAADGGKLLFSKTFHLYELGEPPSYVLAASLEGGREAVSPEPCFYWFSADTLPVKSMAEIYAAVSPEKTVRPNI
jgi:phosphopantetheinyl transferase